MHGNNTTNTVHKFKMQYLLGFFEKSKSEIKPTNNPSTLSSQTFSKHFLSYSFPFHPQQIPIYDGHFHINTKEIAARTLPVLKSPLPHLGTKNRRFFCTKNPQKANQITPWGSFENHVTRLWGRKGFRPVSR